MISIVGFGRTAIGIHLLGIHMPLALTYVVVFLTTAQTEKWGSGRSQVLAVEVVRVRQGQRAAGAVVLHVGQVRVPDVEPGPVG
ncbi:hypothetical protein [Streptomyces sp. NPDC021212]|uniref:hypothetical protein n=1 Tax=Streptomyces sp. NPDC021212 TaxID=3365118 RepID=UPI0037B7260E